MTTFRLTRAFLSLLKRYWFFVAIGLLAVAPIALVPISAILGCSAIAFTIDIAHLMANWRHRKREQIQMRILEEEIAMQDEVNRKEAKQRRIEQEEIGNRTVANQRRCEMMRLECELLYDRHASELAERLPRDRINSYLETYMPLDGQPDEVRDRASMLKDMIADNLGMAGVGNSSVTSMEDIADAFRQKRKDLKHLDTDDETRQSMLASLKMQEREAIRKAIEVDL